MLEPNEINIMIIRRMGRINLWGAPVLFKMRCKDGSVMQPFSQCLLCNDTNLNPRDDLRGLLNCSGYLMISVTIFPTPHASVTLNYITYFKDFALSWHPATVIPTVIYGKAPFGVGESVLCIANMSCSSTNPQDIWFYSS